MTRVRFAPSPTGYLHIGNARTALFNWLWARKKKGSFIIRIEDTDLVRSEEEYIHNIAKDLKWLGLDWDEGLEAGGEYGPYRQTERLDIYRKYADELLSKGKAYYCYCTPEELEASRKSAMARGETPRYDNHCRNLSEEEKEKFQAEGRKAAIRFKSDQGIIRVKDLVRGEVNFDAGLIGDFIIVKQGGVPTFIFAVSIDDYLMKITHVARGEDHLSNTPKSLMIFKAFNITPPEFAHMSLTMAPGGERLSKRNKAMSIAQLRDEGFLPEAVFNYLALLGWYPRSGKELLPKEELIREFDLKDLSHHQSIFDFEKLKWVNAHYIKNTPAQKIMLLSLPYFKKEITDRKYLEQAITTVQDNIVMLKDIPEKVSFYFEDELKLDDPKLKEVLSADSAKTALSDFVEKLEKEQAISADNFKILVKAVSKDTKVKGKELYHPLRAALTGLLDGPELVLVAPVLGKERCLKRLNRAIRPQ